MTVDNTSRAVTRRLTRNAARCRRCLSEIESTHTHDYRSCACGAIAVDGGLAYARRSANNPRDIEELCEWSEED